MTLARRATVAILVAYTAWLVLAYRYHFIDGVNLLVHEAGHLVFAPLGQTFSMLGGTLLQLAFPLAFVVYFARRGQPFEAGVCGVWAAESGMYTATYMGDANALALPLVGGHLHDWRWLFQRAGVLDTAEEIGVAVHALASLGAIVAVWTAARSVVPRANAGSAGDERSGATS